MLKKSSKAILVIYHQTLRWLALRCNTERFNSAYATYQGRFGKTIKVNIIELLIICD